jgi:hypothetical protein
VQTILPVRRHTTIGPGNRLVQRVGERRCEVRTVDEVLGDVIEEPVLFGFEAANNRMAGIDGVMAGVL